MSRDPAEIAARLRASGSVFAEDEAALLLAEFGGTEFGGTEYGDDALERAIARRRAGEPLEHIVGWAEFHGRRIAVGPGVFVPRRRSEFLVDRALRVLRPGDTVVELCCGAAAFASVLADAGADVWAADIDPGATVWAARNIRADRVLTGDLYAPLPAALRGAVDLVVVNAPYVPTDAIATMPSDARDFEPRVALDGGGDGLDLHRRIAAGASDWLRPGGRLLIEVSPRQARSSVRAFASAGLTARIAVDDDTDTAVVEARMPRVAIAPGRPDDAGVPALIEAADAYGLALYGPAGYYALPRDRIVDERTTFLVARDPAGLAVGTAALVDHGDGTGELKRMFVEAAARGLGAGAALLDAIERVAIERGIRSIVLETGPAQPDAIALYASAGFAHVPLFGPYIGSTDSVCMAKALDS